MDALEHFRAEIADVGRIFCEYLGVFDRTLAVARPAENVNHALWLTGHMVWAEDFFVMELPFNRFVRRKEWDWLFDPSSEKKPPEAYPSFDEIREEYYRVHKEVHDFLAHVTHKEILVPPVHERRWFPSAAHAIAHQVSHGRYHLGQFCFLDRLRQVGKL
jgi:uncharacterized damage-inducible protein DinB